MKNVHRQAAETSIDNKLEESASPWSGKVAEKILGATNELGDITFLVKFKGPEDNIDIVPASQANILWPQVVIAFYEPKVKWISNSTHTS